MVRGQRAVKLVARMGTEAVGLWNCSPWPVVFICYIIITFLSLEARRPGFDGWFSCVNECDDEGVRRLRESIVGTGL